MKIKAHLIWFAAGLILTSCGKSSGFGNAASSQGSNSGTLEATTQASAPVLSWVSPTSASNAGTVSTGSDVTIGGSNVLPGAEVFINGVQVPQNEVFPCGAPSVDQCVVFQLPASSAVGAVLIQVVNPGGASATFNGFSYTASGAAPSPSPSPSPSPTPTSFVSTLVLQVNPSSCVDVTALSTSAGAGMQEWSCDGESNQSFMFTPVSEGLYIIQPQNDGLCLDSGGGSVTTAVQTVQNTCSGAVSQQWTLVANSDGSYSIATANGGGCLNVYGGQTANGTQMDTWACTGVSAESFLLPGLAGGSTVVSSPTPTSTATPSPSPSPSSSSSSSGGSSGLPACTKYVSQSGSLNGQSAYTTFQAGVNSLVPGDVLCVGPGTYNEQIDVTQSGTAAAPIYIRAYDTSNHPVVDGAYAIPGGKSFISSYTYNDSSGNSHTAQCYEYSSNSYGQPVNANANQGPFPMVACWSPNNVNGAGNNNVLVTIQANYVTWNSIDVTRSRGLGVSLGNSSGYGTYIVGGANGTWYNNIDFLNSNVSHIRQGGVYIHLANTLLFSGNSVTDAGNFADYDHSVMDYGGDNYNVWSWPNAIGASGINLTFTNNKIFSTFTEGIQIGDYVINPPGVQYPQGAWNSAENIVFSHNTVYDTWSAGIYIGNFTGAVVDSNLVYYSGNPAFIHADTGTPSDAVVVGNEEGSFLNPSNLTLTNNVVTGYGTLLDVRECDQCDGSAMPTYSNLFFANNTLLNPYSKGGAVLYNQGIRVSGFTFVNNLIYSPNNPIFSPWYGYSALPSGSVYGNNLWSSMPTNSGSHAGNSDAQQAGLSGSGDVISSSPGLNLSDYQVTAGNADPDVIQLLSGSPAIGKGRSLSNVTTDYFGTSRVGVPVDIGAYQHP